MIKKGILILTIFLIIGSVCAADITDYELPDNFKIQEEYWASNGDYGMGIFEYDDSQYDYYFTNTSDSTVFIGDNITNYTDAASDTVGCDELIEVNGKIFLVECYFDGIDDSKIKECYDFLLEFNKLNNLTPIEI